MNRVCNGTFFFGPAPWGPGEGQKGQISLNIIKFQLQSQFQRFFNQTLCVFSHMKDIKHIRRDFHLVAWVMPQGSDLGVPWGVWGSKFFLFRNSTKFGVWVTYMNGTCTGAIFWVPTPWGLGEGPKGQISLNLNYKVNFKGFKTKLCVSSHKWNIYNISDGIFIRPPGSSPGVGLGVPWGVGGKKNFFSEIQPDFVCELLTWMAHAPAQFFGSPPPGALGRVKGSITVRFLWERGDLRWRAIECVLVCVVLMLFFCSK